MEQEENNQSEQPSSYIPPVEPGEKYQPNSDKKGMVKSIILVLIGLLLIFIGAAGTWTYQHNQIEKKQQQITQLEQKVEGQTKSMDKALSNQDLVSGADENGYYVVKEIGAKFKPGNDLKDLTYIVFTEADGDIRIIFSTRSLMSAAYQNNNDTQCGPGSHPLGSIAKTKGVAPSPQTPDNSSGALLKQFEGYYISRTTPQSSCSESKEATDLETSQNQKLNEALKSIESI